MKEVTWCFSKWVPGRGWLYSKENYTWPEPLYKVVRGLGRSNHPAMDGCFVTPNTSGKPLSSAVCEDAPTIESVATAVGAYIINNRAKLLASVRRRKATAQKKLDNLKEEEELFTPTPITAAPKETE